MTRWPIVAMVGVGCGASARPARAPAPIENRGAGAPAPAASPGPRLPGSIGLVTEPARATGGCREERTRVRQVAPGDDPALVAFLTHEPIVLARGDDRQTQADQLHDWVRTWSEELRATIDRLEATVQDRAAPAVARVEAAARLAQVHAHAGQTLLALGAPEALATDPTMLATYCDALAQQAASFDARSAEARAACRRLAAELTIGAGWWTAVCADP